MKTDVPYNAGEVRIIGSEKYLICGHIWWPVERCNAYHVVRLDASGEPTGNPEYIWDHSRNGSWKIVDEIAA